MIAWPGGVLDEVAFDFTFVLATIRIE